MRENMRIRSAQADVFRTYPSVLSTVNRDSEFSCNSLRSPSVHVDTSDFDRVQVAIDEILRGQQTQLLRQSGPQQKKTNGRC